MTSPWRPTIPQIIAQVKAAFAGLIPGADTALRRSNLGVAAIELGGLVDGEYAYQDWTIDNVLMPDTAVGPYSNRWGALKGATPNGPTPATGFANFADCLQNIPIPSGTLLLLQPGIVFATTALANTGSGGAANNVPIQAVLPAVDSDGSQWNCGAGAALTLVTAIAGINGSGITVAANITNGTAPETNAAFQQRYLQLFRQPPQGGDFADYIEWALEVPGVTRAWCAPLWMGPGTVAVYFMMDESEAAFNGLPQGTNGVATGETRAAAATGDQLTVANWIFFGRYAVKGACRPVTALVYAIAPSFAPQSFTFKYVPSTQWSAVAAAVAAVLVQEGAAALVNTETGAVGGGTVELADIQAAVKAVPQCSAALVTGPADNISTSIGQLPSVGGCAFAGSSNVGNGVVTGISVSGSPTAGNYVATLSSSTSFAVTGPGGSLGTGTVGTPFSAGGVTFTVAAGTIAFANADTFTIPVPVL